MSSANLDPSIKHDLAPDFGDVIVRISRKIRGGDENPFSRVLAVQRASELLMFTEFIPLGVP